MTSLLTALTGFGDLAVLLPTAMVTALWLLTIRNWSAASWWIMAVVACMVLTALAKIAAYACPPAPDLHSPSGHTSLSTLVYGAAALITATETKGLQRALSIAAAAGLILGIAASRILLAMHTSLEVGAGLAIGVVSLVSFGQGYLRHRPQTNSRFVLYLSAAGIVMLVFHGSKLQAEQLLRLIPGYLHAYCT
jgi:membrane-associated phospholipid phosphatase